MSTAGRRFAARSERDVKERIRRGKRLTPPVPLSEGGDMPDDPKISEQNLIECIVSARLWTTRIGPYSAKMQAITDRFAISAALISVITGLAAWGAIAASPRLWAQILVGVMAVATAAVTIIPKTVGYNECAFKAAPLSAEYGKVLGRLLNALDEFLSDDPNAQTHSRAAIDEFDEIRSRKQNLKPFPTDLQNEADHLRPEALEKEKTAAAARKAELQRKVA
jgi:hypothetical protein